MMSYCGRFPVVSVWFFLSNSLMVESFEQGAVHRSRRLVFTVVLSPQTGDAAVFVKQIKSSLTLSVYPLSGLSVSESETFFEVHFCLIDPPASTLAFGMEHAVIDVEQTKVGPQCLKSQINLGLIG
jgi:hypothetical protein